MNILACKINLETHGVNNSHRTLLVGLDAEGNGIYSSLYGEKIKIQENENPSHAFPITPFHLCFF